MANRSWALRQRLLILSSICLAQMDVVPSLLLAVTKTIVSERPYKRLAKADGYVITTDFL